MRPMCTKLNGSTCVNRETLNVMTMMRICVGSCFRSACRQGSVEEDVWGAEEKCVSRKGVVDLQGKTGGSEGGLG